MHEPRAARSVLRDPSRSLAAAVLAGIVLAWLTFASTAAVAQTSTAQALIKDVIGVGGSTALIRSGANYGLVGIGSWVTGKNYRDPLGGFPRPSDHDLRVVVPDGATTEQALATFHNVRSEVIRRVNARFGSRAPDVLRSINIYPPNQLMLGVTNEAEAIAAMRNIGIATPNLGGEPPEGLWTSGRFEFTRAYETKGRLFYNDGRGMRSGYADILSDVIHGEPDVVINTLRGAAQNGEAFAAKALKALKDERPEDLIKNLTRAEGAMQRGRGLAGLQTQSSALLEEIRTAASANPELFYLDRAIQQKIAQYTKQVALESRLIERIETSTAKDKELILRWLQEMRQGASTGQRLLDLASKLPFHEIGQCMRVLFLWFEGYVISGKLGAGDVDGALREALVYAAFEAIGVGTGAVLQVANMMIEDAKAFGFDLMASTQDCEDLLAGIFTVKGREINILDSKVQALSLDQLLLKCQDVECVTQEIGYRARLATDRGLGQATGESDMQIEDRLNARCGREILGKWARRRNEVERMVLHAIRSFKHAPLAMSFTPDPARFKEGATPYAISLQLQSVGTDHAAVEQQLRGYLPYLAGKYFSTSVDYGISVDGRALEVRRGQAAFAAASEGRYTATGTALLKVYAATLPVIAPVEVASEAVIDVSLERDKPEPPAPPAPPPVADTPPGKGSGAGRPACSYEYSDWSECSRATKNQTRRVLLTKPAGCSESSKPVLEQACTPPPSEEDKRNAYFNCLCRCYCGWAGHIGVWYDPEQKTQPECKSSGPCIGGIGAFGCSQRHFFGAPNDCAKGCYEASFGKGSYSEKTADKLRRDANRKFKEPLTLKVNQGKCPVHAQLGEVVTLDAGAEGGVPPHSVTWSGDGEAKDARFTFVRTRQPGTFPITATVSDSEGERVTTRCAVVVDAVAVTIEKTSPPEATLPVGSRASFRAIVKSGSGAPSGELRYRWQPHPEVQFGDDRNPQFETSSPETTATYTKTGNFPMWVNVVKKLGDTWQTVGESNQIPVRVVGPRLKLSASPQSPKVGEKVVVKVQEEPAISDDAIGYWWELKGDATNPGPEPNVPNGRAYSFKAKNAKPVTVIVHGKSKLTGDDLGAEQIAINASGYAVTISEPRYLGPKPQIWKCDTQLGGSCPGLVDVGDQQFAVFRDLFMKVTVSPAPDPAGVRYGWTVAPEGCTGGGSISEEIKLNCSRTGSFDATVTVRTAEGAELGAATRAVNISVSDEMLKSAVKAKEAADKVAKAKQMAAEGDLKQAIGLAQEATQLDPRQPEAATLAAKWRQDEQQILGHLAEMRKRLDASDLRQAEQYLAAAKAINARYPPVVEAEKLLRDKAGSLAKKQKDAAERIAQARDLVAQGRLDEGIAAAEEGAKTDPGNPDGAGLAQKWKAERQAVRQQLDAARQALGAGRTRDASAALAAAQKLHPKYPPVVDLADLLAKKAAELDAQGAAERQRQQQAGALWNEGRSLHEAGRTQDALVRFKESLKLWPDATNQRYVNALEGELAQTKARAAALWNEGRAEAEAGHTAEALSKFKESLKLWPDAANQRYMSDLETKLGQTKSRAAALWDEGKALHESGRSREALAKFRESLRLWPDPANERYVQQFEATLKTHIAPQPPAAGSPPAPPSGSPPAPPAVAIDPSGTWRHSPDAVWKITRGADGRYVAEETGLGNARGPARWTSEGSFRIDYKTRDGSIEGIYELRFAADGRTAEGSVRELTGPRRTANTHWSRVSSEAATTTPRPAPPSGGVLFDNGNTGAVGSGPKRATTFALGSPHRITLLQTYHWNNGRGAPPGTIALRDAAGRQWGPWQARGVPVQGGVQNGSWNVAPNVTLPAGTYTVIDSDPPSWAQNAESQSAGIVRVEGQPAGGDSTTPPHDLSDAPAPAPPAQPRRGLLAHFPLNGNAQDVSGHGLHGHVEGAKPTADRFGRANGALAFGGRDFVEIPVDINPAALPKLTFTAWVRADDTAPIRQVMSHDTGGFDRSLGIDSRGGGTGWSMFAGSGAVVGFQPVEKGRWVFIAGVWDQPAGKVRLHVDDAVVEKAGSLADGTGKLYLGKNPSFGEFFVGAIDEVRLHAEALTPAQIRALRDGGSAVAPQTALAAPPAAASAKLQAELTNRSRQAVHIVVDGKDGFGPQNRLAPGEKRTMAVADSGGVIRFAAGRDGNRLATCRWEGSGAPVVVFDDPASLACASGIR